ncbi:MAG: glycosyltransferase family 4 protein [Candidatus Eremiobacteraeota bacterium]|nr:glycosyltransferase family 4 protein [Candidatus Eremiobacteraeota bacterium]
MRTPRIAMLAPVAWRVPPRHYGPWEYVVSLLTEGLVERGHDVTLFATADSITSAKLDAVVPHPYEEDKSLSPKVWECLHIANVFEHAGEFDLIHNHFDFLPLSYSALVQTPMITTIHGFSSPAILPVYQRYNGRSHYVAISDADRNASLNYLATIHHGISIRQFPLRERPDDYVLFFGRIHPDKGTAEAIETARRAGRRLLIAGIVHDQAYFQRHVAPALEAGNVEYLGPVEADARAALLGGAYALLHLVGFDEPFGLSMIEAMACGTPVIAFGRGSVPEIVRNGLDGFVVSSVDEAVSKLPEVPALDRRAIRRDAEARFDSSRMVDDYIRAYEKVLATQR